MCEALHALADIPHRSVTVDDVVGRSEGDEGIIAEPRSADDRHDEQSHADGYDRNAQLSLGVRFERCGYHLVRQTLRR